MSKRRFGILLTLLLTACTPNAVNEVSQQEASSDCRSIAHTEGKTQICGSPKRVVALGANALELLLELGIEPIGYADYFSFHHGDFDRPDQQIPYLGKQLDTPLANLGTSQQPSLEKLVQLKPDLIVSSVPLAAQYTNLSQIAPTTVFDPWVTSWQDTLQQLAQTFDRAAQAQQTLDTYDEQLAATRKALAPIAKAHPRVLVLSADQLENLEILDRTDFCAARLEDLGFQLVLLPDKSSAFASISIEALPGLQSDLILLQGHSLNDLDQLSDIQNIEAHQINKIQQEWQNNAIAQSLPASQADRVYFIPTYVCRGLPGPTGAEIFFRELQKQLLSQNSGA